MQIEDTLDEGDGWHVIPKAEVATLTAKLIAHSTKDSVPHAAVAKSVSVLAARAVAAGKQLHLLLTGCNTQQLVPELLKAIPASAHTSIWVLCTSEVWPSDVAPFLWHHYGALVQLEDLQTFRSATRSLLGEYTEHYHRQRIQDESVREARASNGSTLEESLANAVRLDRLDRVTLYPGGRVDMAML